MLLRLVKAALVLCVALWCWFGFAGNLAYWGETRSAVEAVTSMSTLGDAEPGWPATRAPWLVMGGALFIVLGKLAGGVLTTLGGGAMAWHAGRDRAGYDAARRLAIAGCGIATVMLFGGFTVVAESVFELWRSETLREPVVESAFRYAAMITLVALFVAADEPGSVH